MSQPTAVLLHSGGMSGRQWRKLAETLGERVRVLAPDFLGSGANPPWPDDAPFDFTQDVAHIEQLIDGVAAPVHLVGHSYGGLIAATVARRRPATIRSLALYDPVAFGVLHAAGDAEGLRDLARADQSGRFLDDASGGSAAWFELFVDYWNGDGAWQALQPAARESFLRIGRKVYYEVRSLLRDRTPAADYGVVTAPALLLTGERSPAAAQRTVALLAAALPRARVMTVPGAGHMGPLTHGPIVNQALATLMLES